jgi:hypothetical protein
MPIWLYEVKPLYAALIVLIFIETVSLLGLFFARKFLLPRLEINDAVNDAVSGTVQAIGVFYGITIGLIAVGVWNTNSNSSELVSQEAASIVALYRDTTGYPSPLREELRAKLREYTVFVIEEAWPAQQAGRGTQVTRGTKIMDEFQQKLYTFEPATAGQAGLHNETLRAFNNLIENRNRRVHAVNSNLSGIMWAVIWVGAAISIGVAYFYNIKDAKVHAILISLMGGFLAMVLFMIIVNDRPFYGAVSISPEPYQLVLDRVIDPK